jgi:hypothetical protein
VITVRAVFGEDEPVAHVRYWMRPGSLICCRATFLWEKQLLQSCSPEKYAKNGPDMTGRWQFFVLQQKAVVFFRRFNYNAITM